MARVLDTDVRSTRLPGRGLPPREDLARPEGDLLLRAELPHFRAPRSPRAVREAARRRKRLTWSTEPRAPSQVLIDYRNDLLDERTIVEFVSICPGFQDQELDQERHGNISSARQAGR